MPHTTLIPDDELELTDEPNEPGEEDIVTRNHQQFYLSDKLFATVDIDATDTEMWTILNAAMTKAQYFPDVWFLSDHGNWHLLRMPQS